MSDDFFVSSPADVKPSNVLINTLGQVKMCDFGISGYLVDSVAKTMDAGCKPYMAVSAMFWEIFNAICPITISLKSALKTVGERFPTF